MCAGDGWGGGLAMLLCEVGCGERGLIAFWFCIIHLPTYGRIYCFFLMIPFCIRSSVNLLHMLATLID